MRIEFLFILLWSLLLAIGLSGCQGSPQQAAPILYQNLESSDCKYKSYPIVYVSDIQRRATFYGLIYQHSCIYTCQVYTESSSNPEAVSPVGASGLFQLMPGTLDGLSKKYDLSSDPFRPINNINAGLLYNRYLQSQWKVQRPVEDRLKLSFASYNAGIGHILSSQVKSGGKRLYPEIIEHLPSVTGKHSKETLSYVSRIFVCHEATK